MSKIIINFVANGMISLLKVGITAY